MTGDLLPLLSDTDRDLGEAYALDVEHRNERPTSDEDRPVDLAGDDGYDWGTAA